jgi:hypothetical protein
METQGMRMGVASEFVDSSIAWLAKHGMLRTIDTEIPEEMKVDHEPDWQGYITWNPIPNTVSDKDIDDIEFHIAASLPFPYI